MRKIFYPLLIVVFLYSCRKSEPLQTPIISTTVDAMYFPLLTGTTWDNSSPASLGWDENELNALYTFLDQKHTKAFLILKNGKIVSEKYFGNFKVDSNWYWASAGKTMTAFLVGIAQQEGLLDINQKTSQYLGEGFTSLPLAKENLITIRHQLTMTTGLDDDVANVDCTLPSCLSYKTDAGMRWAYHNAPYTILEKVVEAATGKTYNNYFQLKVRDKVGMNGLWIKSGYNNVYFSTARSMARFGLLMLNKGKWNGTSILSDSTYFSKQISSSQNLNPSYGYLTWLNGNGLIPNAPIDMFSALGKNDQKCYVVPSKNLVVIRMGEDAGDRSLTSSSFDNQLWGKLKLVMKY